MSARQPCQQDHCCSAQGVPAMIVSEGMLLPGSEKILWAQEKQLWYCF